MRPASRSISRARALGYIEQIDELAPRHRLRRLRLLLRAARRHDAGAALPGSRARRSPSSTDDEDAQDWQRDRIRAEIARTHLPGSARGRRPREFAAGVVDSETGEVDAVQARLVDAEASTSSSRRSRPPRHRRLRRRCATRSRRARSSSTASTPTPSGARASERDRGLLGQAPAQAAHRAARWSSPDSRSSAAIRRKALELVDEAGGS